MRKFLSILILLGVLFGWSATRPVSAATNTFQVTSSADDVNEDGATFTTNGGTIWLGNASSAAASYAAFRFTNIAIPRGATISSAKLKVYSSQGQWINLSFSLAGELSGNSAAFSSSNKPSQRVLTSQKISHTSNQSWSASTWYTLDEMATVIQEIVNQPGWNSGNSLSVIVKGTGNTWGRKFIAGMDSSTANAPSLVISFSSGSSPTATPAGATATRTPLPPTPVGTNTSVPPTNTALPTNTSLPPTRTPTTIPTSLPTATATVRPTNTPTSQPTSLPTATPAPSSTPSGSSTDWNQLAGNEGHTAFVSSDIPAPWKVKWIWNGPSGGGDAGPDASHLRLPQDVQPVIGDGKLFIGHSDGYLRAISQATGELVWSVNLTNPINNAAAYDSETNSVYAATNDGRFWRVNASNGTIIYSNRPGGQILMAPLLAGSTVYIGSLDGTFYAFDKVSLVQRWSYNAGAALVASAAYTPNHGGLVILEAEDKSIHAVHAADGTRAWRIPINADVDPIRKYSFQDTYPVISNVNDVVIVRTYLLWDKMWSSTGGAPSTVSELRTYLTQNPTLQSFFVLNLSDGSTRFVAPVMVGSIGNGGDFQTTPPQAVIKRLPDGSEVAYLQWRTRQACISSFCDGREDTTLGEMNLSTGDIRFVKDYKNQGDMREPTDEMSPLSMAGDTIIYAHWMMMGALHISDRSPGLGVSYLNPILTAQLSPVSNTLAAGTCSGRSGHYCPAPSTPPCDTFGINPGFYVYYSSTCGYNSYFSPPVRNAAISNGTIYWKTVDGAVIALGN
jgi:outer membrane protein assembly factor BamB